jgi:SAM-dependent methyltransferase
VADSTFSADWLALREPVDHRSRARILADTLSLAGARSAWSSALDLGAGTGSNLRYLAPLLPFVREWTLLDHDVDLLARASAPHPGLEVRALRGDLAAEGLEAVAGANLITASALLDLVSGAWLQSLVSRCASVRCGVLFALSYDGEISWEATDPDDGLVRDAVNRHQEGTKGLGPALGSRAATVARDLFVAAGYDTWLRASPWELTGPRDAALALALVEGWIAAAVEVRPDEEPRIRAWGTRRVGHVSGADYALRVGHRDLLALPSDAIEPGDVIEPPDEPGAVEPGPTAVDASNARGP